MEKKHSVKLYLPSYLVDFKQNLRPSSFMSIAQEMAMEGAEILNFGFDDLAKHDLAWVVSRTKLVFNRAPRWKEFVEFSTWHKGVKGLYFIRDYQMTDKDGQVIVNGTSSWITINTKTRTLFRTDELSRYFDISAQNTESALAEPASKILLPKEMQPVGSHKVTYSDVDFIGHANNTAYIVWAMDYLPEELLRDSYPKSVEINFNKETRAGEIIDIFRQVEKVDLSDVITFEGKVNNVTHFVARFVY